MGRSGAEGQQLLEAQHINKSLSALGEPPQTALSPRGMRGMHSRQGVPACGCIPSPANLSQPAGCRRKQATHAAAHPAAPHALPPPPRRLCDARARVQELARPLPRLQAHAAAAGLAERPGQEHDVCARSARGAPGKQRVAGAGVARNVRQQRRRRSLSPAALNTTHTTTRHTTPHHTVPHHTTPHHALPPSPCPLHPLAPPTGQLLERDALDAQLCARRDRDHARRGAQECGERRAAGRQGPG